MKKKLKLSFGIVTVLLLFSFVFTGCSFIGKILGGAGGGAGGDTDLILTQSGFQKAPTSKYLAEYADAGIQKIKMGNGKGQAALDAYLLAYQNTGKAGKKASFVITITDITVELEKPAMGGSKFNVKQQSTYASVSDASRTYTQTISGMQNLKIGGADLSSVTGAFGYMNRNYWEGLPDGRNVSAWSAGSSPSFGDVKKLAGATCKWNVMDNREKDSKGGMRLNDPTPPPEGPQPDRYDPNDTFYKEAVYESGQKKYMWDPDGENPNTETFDGAWAEYVIDAGGNPAKGKQWPRGGPAYQTDKTTVDLETSTIKKEGKYFVIEIKYKQDRTDYACRYAKAMLIGDINPFVAPWDMVYTGLSQTIEVWDSGLLKKVSRVERFTTNANAIIVGLGLGGAENSAQEVYSYSEADYNVQKYTAPGYWKDFAEKYSALGI